MDYKKLQSFSKDWNKGPFGLAYNESFLKLVIDELKKDSDMKVFHYGVCIYWLMNNDTDNDNHDGLCCIVSTLIDDFKLDEIVGIFDAVYLESMK